MDRNANEAGSFFQCSGLDQKTFEVAEFSGVDRVSGLYEFDITLNSQREDITPDEVLSKKASLLLYRDGEYYPYSGLVSEFSYVDKNVDYCTYNVHLVPRLWALTLSVRSRIFQKVSVREIVQGILSDAHLDEDTRFDLSGSYPQLEYVAQYQESDFNFISRLMEGAGIFYFFKENPMLPEELKEGNDHDGETLCICDGPQSFPDISGENAILYKSKTGLTELDGEKTKESIFQLRYQANVIPAEIVRRNYNYRTPENVPEARTQVKGGNTGTVYTYGGNFKDVTGADSEAKIESRRLASSGARISGGGNCAGFRAGSRFTLGGDIRSDLKQHFLLTEVNHSGGHVAGRDTAQLFTYKNSFEALPEELATLFTPEKQAYIPRIPGIVTATVEASGSEYAAIDEQGRYKVRFPFDISGVKNADASKYVRLAQPYSGARYGIHFPAHEGAELVVGYVDGDPDKPLALGTVPNANTKSPVTSDNKFQNIVRTSGGNELVMDDTDKKQKISLKTNANNCIQEDDEARSISIGTTDGNTVVLDDKNEFVKVLAKKHFLRMSYKDDDQSIVVQTENGHVIKLDDKKKQVSIETKAGHTIMMDDDKKSIVLTDCAGENKVTLDGNGGLTIDSQGKIEIKAAQDLTIKAANIKLTADLSIEVKAGTDLKLSGMNIDAKASMNAKVDGMMTDVSGSGITKIKGGMVMIN